MLVCFLLYPVFLLLFAFFGGLIGQVFLWPALLTGHGIVLLWQFVYPRGLFCPKHLDYGGWSIEPIEPSSIPCNKFGSAGYCYGGSMVPDERCADQSVTISFFIVLILHFLIYFGIGALIGICRKKWKERKNLPV